MSDPRKVGKATYEQLGHLPVATITQGAWNSMRRDVWEMRKLATSLLAFMNDEAFDEETYLAENPLPTDESD